MTKVCDNCAYLERKEGDNFCHITNPGRATLIEDCEEDRCPRWERRSARTIVLTNNNPNRKKPVEEFITYEILR